MVFPFGRDNFQSHLISALFYFIILYYFLCYFRLTIVVLA